MRLLINDKFKPKIEAIADDLGVTPNKVVELVLRQYLDTFEAHMEPGNIPQIPQALPIVEEPPKLLDEPLAPIEFGDF